MTKLNRFFASCLLIVSLSVVAMAEGGDTQGPSILVTPPATGQETGLTQAIPSEPTSSEGFDALNTAEAITLWLLSEIF
jgi:hypothetical protein